MKMITRELKGVEYLLDYQKLMIQENISLDRSDQWLFLVVTSIRGKLFCHQPAFLDVQVVAKYM